ncbi:MAG: M43 family zinc metalloprotease [Bacteroidota bacterium]
MRWLSFILFFIVILLFSCQPKLQRSFVRQLAVSPNLPIPASYDQRSSPCRDKLNYAPDLQYLEHTPVKIIRVNFHIMCKADSSANFGRARGRGFIRQVVKEANSKLRNNKKMHLPLHHNNPLLPMRYQYELTPDTAVAGDDGIYFHYDDELYHMIAGGRHQNNYSQDVFKKYGIRKDDVLNVFVMGIHSDSLQSKTYRPSGRGIAFSSWVKVAAWYHNCRNDRWKDNKPTDRKSAISAMRLLNHEIGHTLGLWHTWRGNDGCDDTPNHRNCWNKTDNNSQCDSLWSNNFMDYNAHSSAWSGCQIATIHYNLHKRKKLRQLLAPTWCSFKEDKSITITDTVDWNGAKDLEGHLFLAEGSKLTVRCQVSMPPEAKISVAPGAQLILDGGKLYNDCGKQWQGIELQKKGGREGSIFLTANASIENSQNAIEILQSPPPGD